MSPQVGKTIRLFRINAGIKQKELADEAGISANYLSLIENGKRTPSFIVIEKIALKLNMPISYLLWSEKDKESMPKDRKKLFSQLEDIISQLQELTKNAKVMDSTPNTSKD